MSLFNSKVDFLFYIENSIDSVVQMAGVYFFSWRQSAPLAMWRLTVKTASGCVIPLCLITIMYFYGHNYLMDVHYHLLCHHTKATSINYLQLFS